MEIMMKWKYREKAVMEEALIRELKDAMGLPDYMLAVFAGRGIDTVEKARDMFNIDSAPLNSPYLFEDMKKAVDRIEYAVKKGEKIVIYGDYDVDGVTAIVQLYLFFRDRLKYKKIDYYIPHRQDEGYGLNVEALGAIISGGAGLIVTVDCGISAKKEVEFCSSKGIDVIITDHHIPEGGTIPGGAFAVINPRVSLTYPDKDLSGAGVSYKLVCALAERFKIDIKDEYIEFAALGTIADIVPLSRENRIIARRGFKKIEKTTNPGLISLKAVSGIKEGAPISTFHVGFMLGPRINAAGRLEHANKAVELFICGDAQRAAVISGELNSVNDERKSLTNRTFEQAQKAVEKKFRPDDDFVITVYDPRWNAGILGLVASKIQKAFSRPAFVITKSDDGLIHGSARSLRGINIFEAISSAGQYLERYGGHKMAAGVTLKEENFEKFSAAVNSFLKDRLTAADFEEELLIDCPVTENVAIKDIRAFEMFQPWGEGNPRPLFSMTAVEVREVKLMKSNTMKFYAKSGAKYYNFIMFGYGDGDVSEVKPGVFLDVVFSPSINVWRDEESLVFTLEDYKVCTQ
jgi:single-stranded-DNA-specific exonuclease